MIKSSASSPHTLDPVSRLIFELSKLPGIGEKTATRLAYHVLKTDRTLIEDLAHSLLKAKQTIVLCQSCFTFTHVDPCGICSNPKRDDSTLCVVEKPSDILSIEQSHMHQGKYHVLHGALSPLEGITPQDLKISELLKRLKNPVSEVILAMNPSLEGEATALYLGKLIGPLQIKVTQLAYGIPMGGQLEYTDPQTLRRALQNRVEMIL